MVKEAGTVEWINGWSEVFWKMKVVAGRARELDPAGYARAVALCAEMDRMFGELASVKAEG